MLNGRDRCLQVEFKHKFYKEFFKFEVPNCGARARGLDVVEMLRIKHLAINRSVQQLRFTRYRTALTTGTQASPAAVGLFGKQDSGDPLPHYLRIFSALEMISSAPILGDVLNGMKNPYVNSKTNSKLSDPTDSTEIWAHHLGALLANTAHYASFACGGTVTASSVIKSRFDGSVNATKHFLRVLHNGVVVACWPLDTPIPIDQLLIFCSTARGGNLSTHTAVQDVRRGVLRCVCVGGGGYAVANAFPSHSGICNAGGE